MSLRPRPRADRGGARHRDDAGFTLIEVLVTLAITGVIIAAVSSAFIFSLRTTTGASEELSESFESRRVAHYFVPDVQSASEVGLPADLTTGCATSANDVLRIQGSNFAVAYRFQGTTLSRWSCSNGGPAKQKELGSNVAAVQPFLSADPDPDDASKYKRLVGLTVVTTSGSTHTVSATTRAITLSLPSSGNTPPIASFTYTCSVANPKSCTFNASASHDGTEGPITSYIWDFGDGFAGTGVNPGHVYSVENTYIVKLTVFDTAGAKRSTTRTVRINRSPIASFTATCVSRTCTFDSSGSSDPDGGDLIRSWNFGGAGTGMAANAVSGTFTYSGSLPFNRTITLTVTDPDGATAAQSQTKNLTNAPPVSNWTFSCWLLSCDFNGSTSTDPDGTITAYLWNFAGAGSGMATNAVFGTYNYTGPGTRTVRLTVTDDNGTQHFVQKSVTALQRQVRETGHSVTFGSGSTRFLNTSLEWGGLGGANVRIFTCIGAVSNCSSNVLTHENAAPFTGTVSYQHDTATTLTYRVCSGTTVPPPASSCTNDLVVTFP